MKRTIVLLAIAASSLCVPVAASAAPGHDIQQACGASFGALIAAARSTGTAIHRNYAGGAAAFSDPEILAAHGCTG